MEADEPSSPLHSPPNSTFQDISNFKTPKQNPNSKPSFPQFKTPKPTNLHTPLPQFFTASKQTPSSSLRPRRSSTSIAVSSRSKAARRLKAFELEQSQSSRKAQIHKEKSLRSLSRALTVWLNFLFENPKACGCDVSGLGGGGNGDCESRNGKRDSWPGRGVGIDGPLRSAKRQKDCSWLPEGNAAAEPLVLSASAFPTLKVSLEQVCSFDDLKLRMRGYLSADACKEVFVTMTKLTKNIDDGRLKMKAHCPMVTDLRLKEQALHVLMCYSPVWLRIGLYIVFGGDSLLPTVDVNSDQELAFLKMVVEKQFFSHPDLAKEYAYNKSVEGLYRPGYFEALGNVILKRFLLLVLILDRAKSQSSLPIKYGIDGTDGGSPLLFCRQSSVKSSRQIIHDFLSSEIMHGEGDLFAHLVIVGYKVSYQQYPLLDYEFRVNDIFDDLQDGVRLCRAIQLLKCDTSILTKIVVPSDTHKKNLANCDVAMQYLKQAGVSLSDEDGFMIGAEDVANGEKELTLSILWNMFVHLQLPLLVNRRLLCEEIFKVQRADTGHMQSNSSNLLEMVLQWIQAICSKYNIEIADYAALVDGKAMWCLIDYYFRHELRCSSCKGQLTGSGNASLSATDCSDAVHNFILSQKLTTMLGNFPEVLQTSDILEHKGACNERSVIILLVFLASQLIGQKNVDHVNIHKLLGCNCSNPEVKRLSLHKCFLSEDTVKHDGVDEYNTEDAFRKFKVLQAWWRDMAKHHCNCESKQSNPMKCYSASKHGSEVKRERASTIIQTHFRRFIARRKFLKIKITTSFLQVVIRAWLTVKKMRVAANPFHYPISKQLSFECQEYPATFGRHLMFMVQRHSFILLRRSVLLIQRTARTWISHRRHSDFMSNLKVLPLSEHGHKVSQMCQTELILREKSTKYIKITTIVRFLLAWRRCRNFITRKHIAASKIQNLWRSFLIRRNFLHLKKAVIMIQRAFRAFRCWREFQQYRTANRSAIIIQSHFRGLACRREANRERYLISLIQSRWRGWLIRRNYLYQREAAIEIQSWLRCLKCCRQFQTYRWAAIEIQRFTRGQVTRNRLLGASSYRSSGCRNLILGGCVLTFELKMFLYSVVKLQRWWKRVLLFKSRTKAAVAIQSHARRWLARREACRERHRIVVIQSYWKGYLARKESRGQLLELRLRVQRSYSNVDDGMRLINRLVSALSELLNTKRISSILHTCTTLDVATTHSKVCCETIVAAGAVEILLKLIRSMGRSIPDQEVLKHALSTLRNISCYPHLVDVLLDTKGSIETVLREMLRNKEDGYFIASQLLKKMCSTEKGVDAARTLPALVKRLHTHVESLNRRLIVEKRKTQSLPTSCTEKRFKEANDLLKLITNGR